MWIERMSTVWSELQKGVDGRSKWGQVWGRLRLGWMDGVNCEGTLGNKGMTLEAAQKWTKYRKGRRALVLQCTCRPNWLSFTPPFLLGPVSFRNSDHLPRLCYSRASHPTAWGGPGGVGCITWCGNAVGINCKKGTTTENQGWGVK